MSSHDVRRARALEAIERAPSPSRATVARRDGARFMAGGLASALAFAALGGLRFGSRPAPLLAVSAVAWGAVAAALTGLALYRGRSMLGAPRALVLGAAIAAVPLLALTWLVIPFPGDPVEASHPFRADAICFAATVALGAGPLFAFVRARSEGDPIHPAWTGAALGAAAGAWGAVLIDLHCTRLDVTHVLLGHVAPVIALALVGAAWGRSALGVREGQA